MDAHSISAYKSRGLFRFTNIVFTLLLVLSICIPVQGKLSKVFAQDLSALVTLAQANLSAAQVNAAFDLNGILIVNDLESTFTTRETSGEGYLLTRLFPKGETGTVGQGLYAYLYRVNMSELVSVVEARPCVAQVILPFGAVSKLDYDGDKVLEDFFIISQGGAAGNLAPTQVVQDNTSLVITLSFTQGICSAYKDMQGDSTFFIGFASTQPYKADQSTLIITPAGSQVQLDTRVPVSVGGMGCSVLADPSEIPSPATINFDTLQDETPILASYQATYGVTFGTGVKADSITTPFTARSSPNVAVAPYSPVAEFSINFTFGTAVSHVGFYAGNATGKPVIATVKGWSVAVGRQDLEVCSQSVEIPAGQLSTFVGFYDSQKRINKVTVQYPSSADEIIDDLQFAPGTTGDRLEFPRAQIPLSGGGPKITIHHSDNTRFAATFQLPEGALWMQEQPDSDMPRLRFGLPGSEINSNLDGYPDIPVLRRLIAIPEGSTPVLANIAVLASQEFDADLYPSQPSAMDAEGEFGDPPFEINYEIYKTNANFPAQPAFIYPVGKMRDLNLAMLIIAGGQYNPFTRRLVLFKEVNFEVLFQGGSGIFLPDYSNNPFEPALAKQYGDVLNAGAVGDVLGNIPGFSFIGNEFLIFTHHKFLEAANRLADWKNSKGISTEVIDTIDPAVDAPGEIRAYIKDRYENDAVRPSYVLIFGDSEYIRAFYHDFGDSVHSTYADLDYALMTDGDTFPDLAYGRIPVDTLADANIVVDKIIAYEQNPPTSFSFYDTVTLASFFECCEKTEYGKAWDDRSFVESSEAARAALVAAGKTVNRIYVTNVPTSIKPAYYKNGAALPSAIGASSGYSWPGTTTDIINAFNNGSGLIMHRDHGAWYGWGDPEFKNANIPSLTNGSLTPVVYSINCSSGVWDNEIWPVAPMYPAMTSSDTSWIEQMLRKADGAVSLIGDTRNSPTWANSALARGLFDATWPATDPTYGSSTIHRRLGDILNYAKLYMFAQVSIPQTAGEVTDYQYEYENVIYHVIGDPTLELWKIPPLHAMVKTAVYHWGTAVGSPTLQALPELTVEYPIEGAVITLLQNGQPVGRGTVVGGQAVIQFVADFNPNAPLQVSACLDDDICMPLDPPVSFVYLPLIKR